MTQRLANKSVVRNAAYIFFIKLLPAFAAVVILILYSRKLPQEIYGSYQDFWVKLFLLGTFAYAGLPVTIITYPAGVVKLFAKSITARQVCFFALWLLVWIVGFAWLETEKLPVWLSAALLVMYVVQSVQEALLMVAQKMKILLGINFFYAGYFLIVHFLFLTRFNLTQLLAWLLVGMIIRAVFLSVALYSSYKKQPVPDIDRQISAEAKKLWLHLGLYDLLQTVFRYADKFILASFLPAGLFAVYYNGSQTAEVPFLPYLIGAVTSSLLIQLSQAHKQSSESYLLLKTSGRLLSCIVFPLFFFLFFFSAEIFQVVFTDKYADSVPVFLMAILVLPLRAYNYTTLLQHFHRGALINKGALLDLVLALSLMYPMYSLLGLPGVPLSFVCSTYIQVGYYLWHTARLVDVPVKKLLPLKNWLAKFLLFGVLFFVIHFLLERNFERIIVLIGGGMSWACLVLLSLKWELKMLQSKR